MPHIETGNDDPGIFGLMRFRPETAAPLCELAETLLRAPNSLSRADRELIAAFVSRRNDCGFCSNSHAAIAGGQLRGGQLEDGTSLIEEFIANPAHARLSGKMRALLRIADAVRVSGHSVAAADVAAAREAGASDVEVHDTVLIAAAFCMYNRYVDGLGTAAAGDPALYTAAAESIIANGYPRSVMAAG